MRVANHCKKFSTRFRIFGILDRVKLKNPDVYWFKLQDHREISDYWNSKWISVRAWAWLLYACARNGDGSTPLASTFDFILRFHLFCHCYGRGRSRINAIRVKKVLVIGIYMTSRRACTLVLLFSSCTSQCMSHAFRTNQSDTKPGSYDHLIDSITLSIREPNPALASFRGLHASGARGEGLDGFITWCVPL